MKVLVSLILLCGLAFTAQAVDPMFYKSDQPTNLNLEDRELDYCQLPDDAWNAINASAGFVSELVDDIPDAFECNMVGTWEFYVVEWGAQWQDPTGITMRLYNSACPPDLGPIRRPPTSGWASS